MKANELMIGDWVYAIDDNGEKHPCRANSLEYDYTNKRGDFCVDFYGTGYEVEWPDIAFNVEPIPITPEILEKNGFERGYDNKFSYGRGMYVMMWSKEHYSVGQIHGSWGAFVEFAEIRFVHELQHCLKVVGIDKEIIL